MGFVQADSLAGQPVVPAGFRSVSLRRFLTPTLLDLFFVSVIAWSFMTSGTGWGRLLWDGDTALHTAIGRWILDHRQIPIVDPFSFTMPGAPWLAVEWGTGVLFAVLNGAFGLKGIVFVCGVAIAATLTLLVRSAIAAGTGTFLAIGLGLMANNALMLHYHARPHVFALLLFTVAVWAVGSDRQKRTGRDARRQTMEEPGGLGSAERVRCAPVPQKRTGRDARRQTLEELGGLGSAERVRCAPVPQKKARWIWTLPLIAAVWANLHPGFVLLILYLALVASGYALEWALDGGRNRRAFLLALRYLGVAAACAVSALVNPFGFGLYREIAGYFRARGMTDLIQEFQAPTFRTGPQLYYLFFLFAGLGLLSLLIRHKDYSNALVIVALGYASLTSVRHSTVFVIAALPVIGREWTRALASISARFPPNSTVGILAQISRESRLSLQSISVLPAIVLLAIFGLTPRAAWPDNFDPALFPVDIASKHAASFSAGRVFTTEQWADYLLLANYPQQRVFFDDRSLYGERMFREVADLMMARPGSLRTLERYRVQQALLPPESPLVAALSSTPDWHEIDRDKTAVLFQHAR